MSILLDAVEIFGDFDAGQVNMDLGNIRLQFDPASARKVAYGLMQEADRAENGPALRKCEECGDEGCAICRREID